MRKLAIALLLLPLAALSVCAEEEPWIIKTPEGEVVYDLSTGIATATNGIVVKQAGALLTAQRATVNKDTSEVEADGDVRIQREDQVWVGEHIRYNFKTHVMQSEQFRTGKDPFYSTGKELRAATNGIYTAKGGMVTTEDVSEPLMKVRANKIIILPGKYIEAWNAVLFIGEVPVFYFPYYHRTLGPRANHFTFTPGYRSKFGPFLLSTYNWYWGEHLDGALHLDYRVKRGVGAGSDVNAHLGQWGDAAFKYYYLHDDNPERNKSGQEMPDNRQRINFSYLANPYTNFNIRSQVEYQDDPLVLREFFESEYRQNQQPSTFVEVNKFWENFSLDTYVQPQVNEFFQTVERLPDIRLSGFRQQLGNTPLYYESESSVGFYRMRFAELTNGMPSMDYSATRADTYHQITMPNNFFGWLNFTPRVGGRFTYYGESEGPGATTGEQYRGVFNTGAELSTKASQVWPATQSKFFEVDGIRHIIEPSVNYVFVPAPSRAPRQLPQFDYELPSLRLLPIEFPDYNNIDSIDTENAIRFGLHNRLQTKRDGAVVNLLDWQLYTDWRLRTHHGQETFSDVYSDLTWRIRSWLTLESITRYDVDAGTYTMSFHTLTIQPNDTWSWSLGHFYLRDDLRTNSMTALGTGNNLITSTFNYKLNENWGLRTDHHFDARRGRLQEQSYSLFRDLRSWTAALTLRLRDAGGRGGSASADDFTIAFTFSVKAFPRYGPNSDVSNPYLLLGR